MGLIPGDGGAWLLPRAIGNARAAEMAFTGEPIDAAKALDWGLVSQITEPDFGLLLDDMLIRDGAEIETARFIVPRIEVGADDGAPPSRRKRHEGLGLQARDAGVEDGAHAGADGLARGTWGGGHGLSS